MTFLLGTRVMSLVLTEFWGPTFPIHFSTFGAWGTALPTSPNLVLSLGVSKPHNQSGSLYFLHSLIWLIPGSLTVPLLLQIVQSDVPFPLPFSQVHSLAWDTQNLFHRRTTKSFYSSPWQKARCHPPAWFWLFGKFYLSVLCVWRWVCVFWCVHKSGDKHKSKDRNGLGSAECMIVVTICFVVIYLFCFWLVSF